MSWTQPVCLPCWEVEHPDGREPVRVLPDPGTYETCCMCGHATTAGIYVRRDPDTVPFPTKGDA